MHDNLSQIGRAWVATSLLNNIVPSAPLQDFISTPRQTAYRCPNLPSKPFSLVNWRNDLILYPNDTAGIDLTSPSSCSHILPRKDPQ
jgi:hypothetical protein